MVKRLTLSPGAEGTANALEGHACNARGFYLRLEQGVHHCLEYVRHCTHAQQPAKTETGIVEDVAVLPERQG